jgi:hypothetical protein
MFMRYMGGAVGHCYKQSVPDDSSMDVDENDGEGMTHQRIWGAMMKMRTKTRRKTKKTMMVTKTTVTVVCREGISQITDIYIMVRGYSCSTNTLWFIYP